MVYNRETAFVWSLIVVLFAVHVKTSNVNELSTNLSSQGMSSEEAVSTTKMHEMESEEPLQQVPISDTCGWNKECQNGGNCTHDREFYICSCKKGTSGDTCEIVDECVQNPTKCGNDTDARCSYNLKEEKAECTCSNASKGFDSHYKMCRDPCKSWRDCPEFTKCLNDKDSNLRFCRCPFGFGGDSCTEEIDDCKAIGRDCGTNPNVTCLENGKGEAICYCEGSWSFAFNYEVKDCIKCDCGGADYGCQFLPGGSKSCYCYNSHYQKDGKCEDCNCGVGFNSCKLKNGTKVCDCWKPYSDNGGYCEKCDCGQNSNDCTFEQGEKICSCKPNYILINGKCRTNCTALKDSCKHGGKCVDSMCQCISGTRGDVCENVVGCENYYERYVECGGLINVDCDFNETSKKPYCRCSMKDYLFDRLNKKCKECNCGSQGTCSFEDGVKTCDCKDGYAEKKLGWSDRMECYPCDCGNSDAVCSFDSYGDKICHCPEGYSEKQGVCSACDCGNSGAVCSFDSYGAKNCFCPYGYSQKHDVCSVCDCGFNAECSFDDLGNKICKCDKGYMNKNGFCEQCDCGRYGECYWNDAGEKTCNCNQGYGVNYGKCTRCLCSFDDLNMNCTFKYGVQQCLCPAGYEERFYNCQDIDECKNASACPLKTKCKNTKGSYECICESGYRPYSNQHNPKLFGCTDINECLEKNACPFKDTTECINLPGSYYCVCKSGYSNKFSSYSLEFQGCQKDQIGWRIGYIVLIVGFIIAITGLLIAIIKRKNSS